MSMRVRSSMHIMKVLEETNMIVSMLADIMISRMASMITSIIRCMEIMRGVHGYDK